MKQNYFLMYWFIIVIGITSLNAQNVLIIYDDSPSNANTLSLKSAMEAQGFSVTISSANESSWNNTNPSLSTFDAVIHLNGTTYGSEMPTTGQTALVDYVQNQQGLYIGFEWNAYQIGNGQMTTMRDLILFDRSNGQTTDLTLTQSAGQSGHPVLSGVPNSFTIYGGSNLGTIHSFATDPSTVLMTEGSNDALAIRNFSSGWVLNFHHSGNYGSYTPLSDANVQLIIINFIRTYSCDALAVTVTPSTAVCPGTEITLSASSTNGGSITWDNSVSNGVAFTPSTTTTYTATSTHPDDCADKVTITVEDNTGPVPDASSLSDVTGECSATVSTTPTATDACTGAITGTTSDPLTYSTQGTHVITWSFDDGNGNISQQTQNVIIDDVTNPSITCVGDQIISLAEGGSSYTVVGNEFDPISTNDNCSVASVINDFNSTSTLDGAVLGLGTHTINWTVTDVGGNTATCATEIDVRVNPPGNALDFDGTNDYVDCGSINLSGNAITLECWVNLDNFNDPGQQVISLIGTEQSGNSAFLRLGDGGEPIGLNQVQFVLEIGGQKKLNGNLQLQANTWYHIAGVYDASSGMKIYINGELDASNSQTGSFTSNSSFFIGNNKVGDIRFIDGTIDEVRVWNTARTQCDIQGYMNTELNGNETNLVAYYNFNQGVAEGNNTGITNLPDLTTNSHNGSLNNFALNGTSSNWVDSQADVSGIGTFTDQDPVTPTLADITGECSATATAPTTTDACAGTITGTTSDPLTYNTQGTHVIAWTFDDGNGNSIVVNQNVIIDDITDPVTPTLADVTGECSATATAPTTTDACAGTITGTTSDPLTYNTQGTHVIAWTFDDGNGNSIVVNQNVIIDDITDPVTPTLADITGECSATATAPTTTDACAGTITGTTSDPLTYNTQGTHVIAWTFDDGNGNSIVVNQNVIIDDVTDPVTPTLADVTGECSATATAPTTTDACAGTITGTTSDPLTYNTQGTHVIAWTFDDGNGNSIVVNQNVIIDDITDPVTPTLADITGECSATATAPTTTDACAGTITGTTSDPLTYNTQGTHVIAWTFDDGNGNSIVVNQNVIIDDVTDPVTPTLADITGECSATATAPTTTDACAGTITGTTSDPLTYNTQGTHVIAWTFDDGNGNSIVVNQNVIIDDVTDPVTPTLADITGECSATATAPTTTDACAGTITGTTSDPLTYNTQGTHVIAWTFDDGNGNSIVVNQNVIIDDITDPVTPTLADITGECSATATAPTTTDACAGTITGTTSDPLTYNTQGTHVIAWTFDDGNGNSIVVNQNVIIDDITDPVTPTLADVTGECSATATAPTTTDACAGTITGTTSDPLTYNTQGTHVIAWTFDDGNGNSIVVNQNVIIDDITDPVTPTLANVTGECSATATAPTTTDACAGTITGTTSDPLTYNTQGTHVIAWTFDDGNGNSIVVNQNVIVNDVTDPVTPTLADVTGECSATATAPTTTDACAGTITGTTSDPLTYNTQGTHVIAWTFDDGNGNSIVVNQNVIIDDVTDPVTPTLADITGECSATATAPTTTDACAGTITGTTSDPLTYNTQGTHVIAWTFDDGNGNSIVVNQNVIVNDVTDPVTPTLADITGECSATATAPTTTDACAGTITGTTSDPLTYNTQGTHVIAWTFDDGNGNSIVVNQNVIIDDITDPVTPTLADITGECSATATAPTTTDACAGTITGTTSDPLTYNTQGTHVIAWTFDDGNGNSIVVNQNVIIDDITDPVTPTLADITGECSATATAPTTTDACAGTITGTTSDPLTYNTQGTHVIAWTFDDGNGNSIVVNQNVIVNDVTDPVTPTLADVTGECSATATAPTTTDACAGTITGTTSDPLTYNTQGTHVIAWTFDDGNGNSIVVNQNVIIDDVTDPVTPTLADITGECSATATAPTTTDACAGTITGTTSDPLTYNTQGTHVIAWTFDDGNGNSIVVNQNVIVNDVTDPVTPTLADITGECSATATAPTTTDACAGTITGTTSDPLTYNTQGTHVIAWTFDDGNGNSIVVNQNVIVNDVTDPVTPTLADITGECSATATAPTTTDACAGTITGTTSDPLTYNTQGTHVIAWTFDDGNGNSIVVNQNVIIDDITDPVTPTLADITGECSATATAPTTTDACAGTITGTTSDPLTYNTQGTHVIAWTFDDGNGNSIVVNQNVIIDDITDPVTPTLADVTGECSATATAPTTTDACAGTITGTTSDPLTYNTQGTHVIAWTFDDGNGNSIVVNQNVIINDISAPVADVTDLPTVNEECSATLTAPTATDNCDGMVTATTTTVFPVTTSETITWTYTDISGNISTQNQEVVIEDITDPTITCPANFSVMADDNSNTYTVTGTDLDPLTTDDNCGVASAYNSVNMGSSLMGEIFNLGTTTVNWTVEDISGRLATCSFDVTVDEFVGIEDILNATSLSFHPNPTHGKMILNYKSAYLGSVKLRIVDMSGREVFIETFNKMSEELNEELNLNSLSTGAYYLVIQTEKHTITRKLIRSDK